MHTSIPLNTEFQLIYNDQEVESSKLEGTVIWTFECGVNEDDLQADARIGTAATIQDGEATVPAYRLPSAGAIRGKARLFEKPLERGKSELLGRSHGFFVRVRDRLINLDDPTFNVGVELHHGTLTRFNMEVNADELDPLIASPRESIQDSPALRELKEYLLAIFNRARGALSSLDDDDFPGIITSQGRIADPPTALTQGPLRRMLQRAVDGDEAIRRALGLKDESMHDAAEVLSNREDLLEQVVVEPVPSSDAMVTYDPLRKAAVINADHPFINNYLGAKGAAEPLRLLGLTELLTQAYMLDEDVTAEQIVRVVERRDRFLRELVRRHPHSAGVVAQQLRDASNDEKLLEDAVADALELLGFSVLRVSGGGDTDGIATARLGRREGESESYAFTYDAKSSGSRAAETLVGTDESSGSGSRTRRTRASTAQTSVLRVHRERAKEKHDLEIEPEHTLLVAPAFQGDGRQEALIGAVCENDSITPITVGDLARLVELFPIRVITPHSVRGLLDARSPDASRAFVDELEAKEDLPSTPPVGDILNVVLDYSERRSAVTVDTMATALYERTKHAYDVDLETLEGILRGLAALAPKGIYFDNRIIATNASPRVLMDELHEALDRYPAGVASAYREALRGAEPTASEERTTDKGAIAVAAKASRRPRRA